MLARLLLPLWSMPDSHWLPCMAAPTLWVASGNISSFFLSQRSVLQVDSIWGSIRWEKYGLPIFFPFSYMFFCDQSLLSPPALSCMPCFSLSSAMAVAQDTRTCLVVLQLLWAWLTQGPGYCILNPPLCWLRSCAAPRQWMNAAEILRQAQFWDSNSSFRWLWLRDYS